MKNLLEGASGNNSILRSVVSMARPRDKHHDRFVATSSNPLHRGDRRNGNRLAGGTGRRRRGTSRPSQRRPSRQPPPRPLRWIARWAFRSASSRTSRPPSFPLSRPSRRFPRTPWSASIRPRSTRPLARVGPRALLWSSPFALLSARFGAPRRSRQRHACGGRQQILRAPDDVPRRPIAPRSASRSRP